MPNSPLPTRLRTDPECQSALTRLAIWVFGSIYLGIATYSGYYTIPWPVYFSFFSVFLLVCLGILASVYLQPGRIGRRYLSMFLDLIITSIAVYLTDGAHSPFFLLYIWIFIAYGTRYGQPFLALASFTSAALYTLVISLMQQWETRGFEATFQLVAIFLLPVYLNSLLNSLHRTRMAADAANRAKSEFLANISHEIRTPLHGALGMLTLLKSTPLNREQEEYLANLNNCARILRTLLDDVLDFSKIEAGKLHLEELPFQVAEVIREVVQLLSPLAREKGLPLETRLPDNLPGPVVGDALRLRQVLLNLVGNAIKFTERGTITVTVTPLPAEENDRLSLRFQVEDTGIGIPHDQIEHIFESFHQAHRSTTRLYGGSGLGTSISSKLVQMMGGRMGVESEPGQGSRFWFELQWPLLSSGAANNASESGMSAPPKTELPDEPLPVLLAEDSAIGARAVVGMLGKLGIEVEAVSDGREALERMREKRYGLVLMDMRMPILDGLEATRRWRADETGPASLPIIALTANVTMEDRARCLEAGMDDFLAKPVDLDQLTRVVLRYLPGETA